MQYHPLSSHDNLPMFVIRHVVPRFLSINFWEKNVNDEFDNLFFVSCSLQCVTNRIENHSRSTRRSIEDGAPGNYFCVRQYSLFASSWHWLSRIIVQMVLVWYAFLPPISQVSRHSHLEVKKVGLPLRWNRPFKFIGYSLSITVLSEILKDLLRHFLKCFLMQF